MVTDTGSSTLKVRIDKTRDGNIFLSGWSSGTSSPNLNYFRQDQAQCFGWYGYTAHNYHTGIALGQPWQTGDITHLTLDHGRHTLIGRHERTGAMETIRSVTGSLYWIVTLHNSGDEITLV